jgi:hypothetical protein
MLVQISVNITQDTLEYPLQQRRALSKLVSKVSRLHGMFKKVTVGKNWQTDAMVRSIPYCIYNLDIARSNHRVIYKYPTQRSEEVGMDLGGWEATDIRPKASTKNQQAYLPDREGNPCTASSKTRRSKLANALPRACRFRRS